MMKELLERWKSPLNSFWQRILTVLLFLSTILVAVSEFVQPMLADGYVPEEWKEYLRMAYVAGYFGAALAKLTKADPNEQQ